MISKIYIQCRCCIITGVNVFFVRCYSKFIARLDGNFLAQTVGFYILHLWERYIIYLVIQC